MLIITLNSPRNPRHDRRRDKHIRSLAHTCPNVFFTNFRSRPPSYSRPVILMQGLVPYLGYLGGLLSWSWGTIRTYDEGKLVTLPFLRSCWLIESAYAQVMESS